MRLGPVLFIAVSVAFVVFLFMVVGAAKGLGRAPILEEPTAHLTAAVPQLPRTGLAEGPAGGMASSYGPGLWGNRLGCGGRLWRTTVAVAHKSLPCGTALRVCWRNRCQGLLVRDRGPFVFGRSLDLTEAAVRRFGFASARSFGVQYVEWRVL